MKLSLVSIERDVVQLEADGPITVEDFAVDGKNPLEGLLGIGWPKNRIVLSARKVPFIDSSAIGWLVGSNKEFRTQGGAMVVHSLQPPVRQVLDLLKVGRIVKIATTEAEARAVIGGAA